MFFMSFWLCSNFLVLISSRLSFGKAVEGKKRKQAGIKKEIADERNFSAKPGHALLTIDIKCYIW